MTMIMTSEASVPVSAVTDTASLDQREAQLRQILKKSMIAGDAATVIDARNELTQIPLRRRAFDLERMRKELDAIEARFEKNATDEAAMIEIRSDVSARLEPALDLVAEIGKELEKVNFGLSLVYSERQGLIEERRERRANISRIVTDISKEVGINEH